MEATEMQQHEIAEIEEFAEQARQHARRNPQGHRRPRPRHRRSADRSVRQGPLPARRRAGTGEDALDQHTRGNFGSRLQPHPVHARLDAVGHHRHGYLAGRCRHRPAQLFSFSAGRSSPTSCSRTKSTARRPRRKRRFCNRCRNTKSPPAAPLFRSTLPFFVLATQNPIEQEGTYPLPEAQLDRFMVNVEIGYPDFEDEVQIVMQTTSTGKPSPRKIMDGAAILHYQELVRKVPVSPFVVSYAVSLAQRSRPQNADASSTSRITSNGAPARALRSI